MSELGHECCRQMGRRDLQSAEQGWAHKAGFTSRVDQNSNLLLGSLEGNQMPVSTPLLTDRHFLLLGNWQGYAQVRYSTNIAVRPTVYVSPLSSLVPSLKRRVKTGLKWVGLHGAHLSACRSGRRESTRMAKSIRMAKIYIYLNFKSFNFKLRAAVYFTTHHSAG